MQSMELAQASSDQAQEEGEDTNPKRGPGPHRDPAPAAANGERRAFAVTVVPSSSRRVRAHLALQRPSRADQYGLLGSSPPFGLCGVAEELGTHGCPRGRYSGRTSHQWFRRVLPRAWRVPAALGNGHLSWFSAHGTVVALEGAPREN